jgi:thiamine-phosphate pyrophosphorylase
LSVLIRLADQLRLMVITDPVLLQGRDPVHVCRAAVRGGATIVQVRWKDAPPRDTLALVRALVAALPVPVLVNDRVDVALAAGAAGAHLGQDDVPLDALRPHVPLGFFFGASVGSPAEAERARGWRADYWSVGPCYATANKPDAGVPLGAAGFMSLAGLAPGGLPVIAIGGITAGNAADLARAGAAGLAVIGAVLAAPDPESATRAIRDSFDAARTTDVPPR